MLICTNEDCGTENRDEATYCTKCGTLLLKVVGAYRVLELIGKGANGAVYRAEHCQRPGEIRALKAVFKQKDIASLKAEFEVLKDLRHPNLPRYYAWFEHQGYGYLVMEFVPGQNLEQLLAQRRGPLSPTLVIGYALQLCDVLTFLHTQPQRILHRDLKPANIRLTHADVVKLVDFGLLKQGTDATRQTQRGLGTLVYMPVEQHGSGTNERSDLYSLGATLYHLLTGHEPPQAADRVTTTLDSLPPPCQLNPALSPYVAAVVVQAMSRVNDDRYPNVASFKAALEYADVQPFQPGTGAPVPGGFSAGAPTLLVPPPPPDHTALRRLWQQAWQAYLLKQWVQAEELLSRVAALNPQYEDVQTLLAEAKVQADHMRRYVYATERRAANAWEQVLAALANLPPNFPDPLGHQHWAEVRQRRDQYHDAALLAAKHETWHEVIAFLRALLAETPNDEPATELLAHAQAKWAEMQEMERQRQEAERLRREAVERQRQEAERRQREEAERQRQEVERRQREAAERQRQEAERQREEAERTLFLQWFERQEAESRQRKAAERQEAERIQRLLPAMVEVLAGSFLMGSRRFDLQAQSHEKPQHTLTLLPYWIGKTPVTNAQFRPFVDSDGYSNQAYWTTVGWQWREAEKVVKPEYWDDATWNGADYPVVGVSWFEAVAYCRWLSKQTGSDFRLPTEAEWEKAARGSDGRIYPWGNTWEAGRCNSEETGLKRTTPVGQYPTGASPCGALDMAGNVAEWCATKWFKSYPYQLEDEWQAAYVEADENRVIRGGACVVDKTYVRGAFRVNYNPRVRNFYYGLRVASHSLVSDSGS